MFDVIRMWNEMMGCVSSKLGGCLKQVASVSGSGNWKLLNVMLEVVQHPAPTCENMWVFYIESVNEIIKNYFNIFLRLNIFGENQIELHKASCRAPLPPSRQPSLTHRSKLCVDFWPQTNSTLCCSLCLVGVKYQVSSIKQVQCQISKSMLRTKPVNGHLWPPEKTPVCVALIVWPV